MSHRILTLFTVLTMLACSPKSADDLTPVKVEIRHTESGYELLRGGEPYVIRGAGMAVDDVARFAAYGGNSIRTWTTSDEQQSTAALLEVAQSNGVTVALGLPMRPERSGFDYDDKEAIAAQLAAFRAEVLKYRNHPALLFWIVGNELNHSYTNPAVYDAVNDVAEMIHELDPNHPVTTTISGYEPEVIAEIESRASALDFISFQTYGSLFGLPGSLSATEFDAPFMVTEWGTLGYWDMEQTAWGAPMELTSSEKADVILRGHRDILAKLRGQLIGDYVFFWGQKQERTPTWFGLLTEEGETTEAADVMQFIWTGDWPENRSPRVDAIRLDGRNYRDSVVLSAGEKYAIEFDVADPDGDPLRYAWEIKPESRSTETGGDFEQGISSLDGLINDPAAAKTEIVAPEPGAYRLFAYAYDDHGHTAHANIPFMVEPTLTQRPEDLLAGEVMAVAYSGFREGQHPDRGNGAVNPSDDEIREDLDLLVANGFRLVRLYDSGENSASTLALIRNHDIPIKVLLGIWLDAEVSNHEGCPWLDEPIPTSTLEHNTRKNAAELARGIALANEYDDIVVAVNVGNEALVEWNDHMVPLDTVIRYVRQVKESIPQPVTVADNYAWWIKDGAPLAKEVDFLGVHTYPAWEEKSIHDGLSYTVDNIRDVKMALPDKPIAILEAGWATTASEFGARANEENQDRYFRELEDWARQLNISVFFFEAFDEPWKGDPGNPLGAEKHWGLFFEDRTPKLAIRKRGDVNR